jgi:hypothetical protein
MFWGGMVFYTMELPAANTGKIKEKDLKQDWIYSVMMVTCTISFFHLILFIMLITSVLMYACYACSGNAAAL